MHTNYAYYTFLIFRLNYKYSDVFGLTVEYLVYRILININVLIIVLLTVF